MKKCTYLFMVGLLLMLASSLAVAEFVVVASTSGSLKSGDLLQGSQDISVSAGEKLTLLSSAGRTVQVNGPFTGTVASQMGTDDAESGAQQVVAALSELLKNREMSESRLLVGRDISFADKPLPAPELFAVESNATDYCLIAEHAVFWRSDATSGVRLEVKGEGLDKALQWRSGADRVTVDAGSFVDGRTYQIMLRAPSATHSQWFSVHHLQENQLNIAEKAAWLVNNGCQSQALAMLDELK